VFFVPPLATNLDDLKNRIMAAVTSVKEDTLRSVWDEFNYRLMLFVKHVEGK
jgi:hypothetical protein